MAGKTGSYREAVEELVSTTKSACLFFPLSQYPTRTLNRIFTRTSTRTLTRTLTRTPTPRSSLKSKYSQGEWQTKTLPVK